MPDARPFAAFLGIAIALAAAACRPQTPPPTVTPAPTGALTPYTTPTPTQTPAGPGTATPTPLPTPTPTPLTYKVVKGDDMFGIALRFGVSVAALKTANPTVNPYFLSIGTILTIPQPTPAPGPSRAPQPSPTPLPIRASEVHCYPAADGGLWCLAAVTNIQSAPVENVSASIVLLDSAGAQTSLPASAALNLLPAGKTLPLEAYFPPPIPAAYTAGIQNLDALPLGDPGRYLPAAAEHVNTTISERGLSARLSGDVTLPTDSAPAEQVWLVAAAYDAAGAPVGLRKWESNTPLAAGGRLPFSLDVYSLGPEISKVDLFVEAHP